MRVNLFADSFIRQVLILLLVLFVFGAGYLNSILYNRVVIEPLTWQALERRCSTDSACTCWKRG